MTELEGIASQKVFYIVSQGDPRGSGGQEKLYRYLTSKGVEINRSEDWNAQWSQQEFREAVNELIVQSQSTLYFSSFIKGTTLPPDAVAGTTDHMYSYDYAYKIDTLRDWLFEQNK